MSAPRASNKPFSLANYAAEAQGKPLEFWVDDDTMLNIERPTGDTMFKAEEAQRQGDTKALLRALCGKESAEQLIDLFSPLPADALRNFVTDLAEKLGLGG